MAYVDRQADRLKLLFGEPRESDQIHRMMMDAYRSGYATGARRATVRHIGWLVALAAVGVFWAGVAAMF